MLDMFNVGDTSLLLLIILGGITVYYIITDEASKIVKSEKKEKPSSIQTTEESKDSKEQPKDIERKQNTDNSNINSNIMEQTDDYRPTHSAPLPKIKAVTTTTEYYVEDVQQPTSNITESKDEELQLYDFESDEVEVQCKWCDSIIRAKKGTSVVCPNCSGTIDV